MCVCGVHLCVLAHTCAITCVCADDHGHVCTDMWSPEVGAHWGSSSITLIPLNGEFWDSSR